MDCKKILDDTLIKPSLLTAIYGVLSISLYNDYMNRINIKAYSDYRKCFYKKEVVVV
jgi:hypothetical protein